MRQRRRQPAVLLFGCCVSLAAAWALVVVVLWATAAPPTQQQQNKQQPPLIDVGVPGVRRASGSQRALTDIAYIESRLCALDEERRRLLSAAEACLKNANPPPFSSLGAAAAADEKGSRPFRVIFVCDHDVSEKSMSRWFFDLRAAMDALRGVETVLWGPGFPGYRDNLTLADNVQLRWGVPAAQAFDFALNNTIRLHSEPQWLGVGAGAMPVAVWQHECLATEKIPARFLCPHEDVDLTFHAYAPHMSYYADRGHGRLLWHLPHAAHLPDFPQPTPPHSERPVDVLLAGNVWTFYPLRLRFKKLINAGLMPGVALQLQHPGYWVSGTGNQTATFAQSLLGAKIVLVCSSKRRYAVRKYVEAAAAGALVIGDIPNEREEEFRSFVVEVHATDTDEELLGTVRWWLEHSAEREARARAGQKLVLSRYTTSHAAQEMIHAMKQYIAGARGLVFPHPFSPIDHFLPGTRACAASLRSTRIHTPSKLPQGTAKAGGPANAEEEDAEAEGDLDGNRKS